jgi:phage terminase large subunit-like protein
MSRSIVRPLSCKWQGESLDYLWFDEEPPQDVYSEGLTRISATGRSVFMTFTPLLGMSEVVRRFLTEASADRSVTRMTIEDAGHISAAERARIVAGYPAHEREARAMGLPQLGSGRIFPLAARDVAIESFAIPRHWPVIGGLDFGWDHPTAAVRMAWDRDADCLYVTHAYRQVEATPLIHAAVLKEWGAGLDWAWPADGLAHDKGSGVRLAELYRAQGCACCPSMRGSRTDRSASRPASSRCWSGCRADAGGCFTISRTGSRSSASITARTGGSSRRRTTCCRPRGMR